MDEFDFVDRMRDLVADIATGDEGSPWWAEEIAQALAELDEANSMLCVDCDIDTVDYEICGEYYMVHDEVWLSANLDKKEFCCIGCLEKRLGRQLTSEDFTDCPLNRFPSSAASLRLLDRLGTKVHRSFIMPAEWFGHVETPDRVLRMGNLEIPVWCNDVHVYVRRVSDDLSVAEIHVTRHDGLAQEELDEENHQAAIYPLGPKEYWRQKMVGKYLCGLDQHLMTDEEFETDWAENEEVAS